MKVGSAKVDITPPLNIPYLAYLPRQGKFKGVHDPLYARALVLDDGKTKIAIISADSIGYNNELLGEEYNFLSEVRGKIQERTGILGLNVMLATTHSHSTPETTGITRLLDVSGAEEWLEVLIEQLTSVVEMADQNLVEMSIKAGIGEARGIAKNRRKREMSLDEQRSNGFVDESVGILLFQTEDSKVSDIIINYACHPVTVQVQPLVSADYPGVTTRLVENVVNGCRNCLFLQGSAGDINPMRDDTRDFRDVEIYGNILGGEAIKTVAQMKAPDYPIMPSVIGIASKMITLPSRNLPDPKPYREAFVSALDSAQKAESQEERDRHLRVARYNRETLKRIERGDAPIPVEIQVLRIGDAMIIGIPGEVFVGLGLQIKRESPAPYTFISETTNGWIGYIPTVGTYAEGGYEVHPGPWSMTNEEGGQMIAQTAIGLVNQLSRQTITRIEAT
ncbi:MAG: neutral/alkaline non-lysosomal ceramidase N-terminal domain-containing protein [Candidatus Poribacteria bacterium]